MLNLIENQTEEIKERINDYQSKGGVMVISVYSIGKKLLIDFPIDEYTTHLIVARQIIEKANYECNFHWNKVALPRHRNDYPIYRTDFEKLDSSGVKLGIEHFLGPFFDLKVNKPLMRGQKGNRTFNSYFYYDDKETPENEVDIKPLLKEFETNYPENKGGFIQCFMEPPYQMGIGKEIKIRGEYLINFMDYFFGDFRNLQVYSWDTNCSRFFDSGKEWWGCYFWTVFSPSKNWFIGLVASTTD